MTALMCACEEGHFDISKLLVGEGADVDAKDKVSDAVPACLQYRKPAQNIEQMPK